MVLISSKEFETEFPSTWAYLLRNRRYLEQREAGKMKGTQWYGFIYPKNLELMSSPKLLVPDIADRASFALDETGNYAFASGYGITLRPDCGLSLKFILGIANSRTLEFYWRQISTPLRGGFFRYFTQFIEQLPIPDCTRQQQDVVETLVDYALWLRSQPSVSGTDPERPQDAAVASFFEQTINALVYELFFADQIRTGQSQLFELVKDAKLPAMESLQGRRADRLQALFELFQILQSSGHPLRIALDRMQTLDLVRTIEGNS